MGWLGFFSFYLVARSEKLSSHEIVFLFYTTILKLEGQHLLGLSRFPLSLCVHVPQSYSYTPAGCIQKDLGTECVL